MVKLAAIPAIFLALCLFGTASQAADCWQVAENVAAEYGAKVLSVKQEGGGCVVVLLVPGQGGQPPRQKIVRVNG